MSSSKGKALANGAFGNVEQGVGKVTENDKLQAEQEMQQAEGETLQVKNDDRNA